MLVQIEPILAFLPVVSIDEWSVCLSLPFNSLVGISHFGTGGGEGIQHMGILPLSQFAATCCQVHGPFAIPEALLGTGDP